MSDTVLVAIISGLCVGVPSIFTTIMLNNKNQAVINAKVEDNQKFIDYKIQELTDRVDKHNNVVERMALQERETKALWRKVDELKGKDK
ncbi:MAG: hypothetical protein HFF36_02615 [Coprobacillus sp.]|nr:hypothetical protein [Coprobacillus sp.]